MSMTKMIEIDGREVAFRASAAIPPRIYRLKFQRDIYKDLSELEKTVGKEDEGSSNLDLFSLEIPDRKPQLHAPEQKQRRCHWPVCRAKFF